MLTLLLCLLFTSHPIPPDSSVTHDQNSEQYYLKKGILAKIEGNYEEALTIWEEARLHLPFSSLPIAIEHLRLSTEQQLKDSYPLSSAMYFWGIRDAENYPELIRHDIEMMEPILDAKVYKTLRRYYNHDIDELNKQIKDFWWSVDPSPDTPYNERLVEHWERIAYARKHFTKNEDTVYGTDERGLTWVKYGKPDFTHEGEFSIAPQQAFSLTMQKISLLTDIEREQLGVPNSAGRTPEVADSSRGISFMQNVDRAYATNIESAVFELAPQKAFEIWIYNSDEENSLYNNVVMFGNRSSSGYGRALTVDDFIPASAFTLSRRYAVQDARESFDYRILPATIIQHEYLRQIAGIDPQFGNALANLKFDFLTSGVPRKDMAFSAKRSHFATAKKIDAATPDQVSSYLNSLPAIPVEIFSYRFLDDRNKPFTMVFLESNPIGPLFTDVRYNQDSVAAFKKNPDTFLNYYTYTHGVYIRDKDWQILEREKLFPEIDSADQNGVAKTSSVFIFPYDKEVYWTVFYAQLKNRNPESESSFDSVFPDHLRGFGSITQEQLTPIDNNKRELRISDLVLGYDIAEKTDSVFVPFTVAHNKLIPKGEQLVFHYEVYHLKKGKNKIRKLEIELEVKEKDERTFRLRRRRPDVTFKLNQDTDQEIFRENLEVVTNDLEAGTYILSIKFTDTISKQSVEREIEFQIAEE